MKKYKRYKNGCLPIFIYEDKLIGNYKEIAWFSGTEVICFARVSDRRWWNIGHHWLDFDENKDLINQYKRALYDDIK